MNDQMTGRMMQAMPGAASPGVTESGAARHVSAAELQRSIGVVVGAAVGDALGAPFEFLPAGTYGRRFPQPVLGGIGEMVGGGAFGWAPGEFTDDTQMAMALAESMLAHGGYDPDAVWNAFRTWADTARDIGVNTRRSLSHDDWRLVGRSGAGASRSAGNGALMRAFPLAVAFLDAPDDVAREVVLHQAALTHHHPAAGWGAWVAVAMMRAAIRGADPMDLIDALLDQMPAEQADEFAPLLGEQWSPERARVPMSNGTVWGCLAQAVWAVRNTTSFEAAVVVAISLGDDTDTVACVAGALAGAVYGVQSIPSRWATYVHGTVDTPSGTVRYWGDDMQAIALRLLGRPVRVTTPPESPAGPVEVAPGLYAADLLGAAGAPTDHAVVSLCRTGARFNGHAARREVFLLDEEGGANPQLPAVLNDAVDAVDAFLAEGKPVVVHCHGGRSRTGLVLKAWKMRRDGVSEREAHDWLAVRWERYADYNRSFIDVLRSDWNQR